jgi:hypothetical protein
VKVCKSILLYMSYYLQIFKSKTECWLLIAAKFHVSLELAQLGNNMKMIPIRRTGYMKYLL